MDKKEFLTAEQARDMIKEIVGESVQHIEEKHKETQVATAKEIAYALRHTEPKRVLTPQEHMRDFQNLMGCYSQAGGNLDVAANIARGIGNDRVEKALNTTTVSAGGAIVPTEFASEIIPLLRADAVVLASGARTVPMDSGILHYGRVGSGATAYYRGESSAATASEPTLEEVELRARILTTLTPASNQLLSRTGGRGMQFIQEDMINATVDKMDSTLIRSVGSAHEPTGLLYAASSANKFNETNAAGTTGASTTAEVTKDLGKMMRYLMDDNVPGKKLGWLMAPRTWQRLFTELDSNGNPVFRADLERDKLFGIPFKVTTNIPITLTAAAGSGAGSDASELYLCDFNEILIGETEALRLSVSTEASYTASGSLVSSFERGETLIKVEMEHDMATRRGGVEICVLESVTWGTV